MRPPFAGGVGRVGGAVRPVPDSVVRYVQPVVDGVGDSATTLAYGVTGDIRPFAYGVAGEVAPVGTGTAGQAAPLVGDLAGTVGSAAVPLAANAAGGVQGMAESVTPSYLPPVRGAVPRTASDHPRRTAEPGGRPYGTPPEEPGTTSDSAGRRPVRPKSVRSGRARPRGPGRRSSLG
ncbi:hypothetical protein C6Y14_07680 [Streptomyces dioscori]|uniref:Uncharacterized protein n=1 Tax=Streptomyces dioscori TaxID=2109333 RepID=A0A2P8QDA5_9ACTN|nr:hypothetical protein [Streptomyces dioscori]PSM44216.1 hypothetical protein C6Y14_07680 [Streptomyces dioscori]